MTAQLHHYTLYTKIIRNVVMGTAVLLSDLCVGRDERDTNWSMEVKRKQRHMN